MWHFPQNKMVFVAILQQDEYEQKPTLLNNPVNVSIFTLWQLILVSLCLSPGSLVYKRFQSRTCIIIASYSLLLCAR